MIFPCILLYITLLIYIFDYKIQNLTNEINEIQFGLIIKFEINESISLNNKFEISNENRSVFK